MWRMEGAEVLLLMLMEGCLCWRELRGRERRLRGWRWRMHRYCLTVGGVATRSVAPPYSNNNSN